MDPLAFFIILSIAEFAAIIYLAKKIYEVSRKKQSMASVHGRIFEELIPFSAGFPFEPKDFRFIGEPVDGVAFTGDEVVFCEIKLNNSALSCRQKHIKNLIQQKKVRWQEIRGR